MVANHVIISESRLDDILQKCNNQNNNGITGSYGLNVMFQNASSIEKDLNTVLENHGYQNEYVDKENYIKLGINWGYVGAQLSDAIDFSVILGIFAALILIIFTGYLIIYNIFQIPVSFRDRYSHRPLYRLWSRCIPCPCYHKSYIRQ